MPDPADPAPRPERRTVVLAAVAAGLVALVVVAIVVASGGGDDRREPPLATTTTITLPPDRSAPGAPTITAFDVPSSVRCDQATTLDVSWTTSGAVGVQIAVDGPGPFAYHGPNGSAEVPFPCDDTPHVYRLIAVAPSGATSSRTVRVAQRS